MKMTVSYGWLCDLVSDLDKHSPKQIGLALTSLGAEVEDTTLLCYGSSLEFGEILSITPLKNFLKVSVKTKTKTYSVVSNSSALCVGHYVIFAPIGMEIFGGSVVSSCEVEGIKTEGLLIALENLGIEAKSTDIVHLGNNIQKAQELFDVYCELDAIYTLDVPGNRADWLSVRGLARALAIHYILPLKEYVYTHGSQGVCDKQVEIQSERCHRYSLTKISCVYKHPTSAKIQKRLFLLGMRPINYLVDMSNATMLETGQPTHAFDARKISGKIIIRQAQKGEQFTLLDGSEIVLTQDDLLICDEKKILALAGIMGGLDSGIDDDTKDVYLESANFNGVWIRRTSKRLGLKTESSLRFEKNITAELVSLAQKGICEMITEDIPQSIISEEVDVYPYSKEKVSITLSPQNVRDYLGAPDIDDDFMARVIEQLGCICDRTKEQWLVIPSGERRDLCIKEDLMEEIARFYGYDNIPSTAYRPSVIQLNPEKSFDEKLRPLLRGMGLSEAVTMVFRSEEQKNFYYLNHYQPVAIINPLNKEWTELRTHLFDGLLESLKINVTKGFQKNVSLSEMATVFSQEGTSFCEQKKLSFVISNEQNTYQKGLNILNNVLLYAKLPNTTVRSVSTEQYPFLHPSNSFEILLEGKIIGFYGEIHPVLLQKIDLSDKKDFPAPIVCELLFDVLKESASGFVPVQKVYELPPLFRDITLSVEEDALGINVVQYLKEKNPLIKEVEFISAFQNEKLKALKKKNLSFRLRFESEDEMNAQEIDEFVKKLLSL